MQAWGDSNGFTGYGSPGYFGVINNTMAESTGGGYFWILLSGTMGIDVGTNASGTTAVQLSLPETSIYTSGITSTLALSDSKYLGVYGGSQQILGTSFMGGLRATITPGTMTISAHSAPF
jgi:hypothetical protein